MGSIVMDPFDIPTIAANLGIRTANISTICTRLGRVDSHGIFNEANPLDYWVPLLLLQITICSGTFLFVTALFKSLGLPMVVRQFLAGMILGPSLVCKSHFLGHLFFPLRGYVMMDTAACFGFIFYFFLIGIQMDPGIFKNLNKTTVSIGFCSVAVPVIIASGTSMFIIYHLSLDQHIAKALPHVASAESLLSIPIVASLLAELKLINSELGRIALPASFVGGACSAVVLIATLLSQPTPEKRHYTGPQLLLNIAICLVVIIFIMRPTLLWIIKQNPEGQPLKQSYVHAIFLSAVFSSFLGRGLGLNLYLGPLVFGISMPAGPPIGSTVVERLDLIVNWFFMPLYLVKNCLVINISTIKLKNYLIVQTVALVAAFGKFLGAFTVSRWSNIAPRDAASIGLVMNAQGVLELGIFKMLRKAEIIDDETFVIMCLSIMVVNVVIAPIIKYLSDPSKRYTVHGRRSVMNLRPGFELRVLLCIHEEENVPALINVLEALNPTKRSPLLVYALHLIELVGSSNALLIPHKLTRNLSKKAKRSEQIIKAFQSFEDNSCGLVSVFPYTAISPPKTMHNDVCTLALERRASLIIVPFHKRLQPNGMVQSYNKVMKITNMEVLPTAPCSTAILVDHCPLNVPRPIFNSQSCYRVAVLFMGGSDDREALSIGAWMAGNDCVKLTLIRLLEKGSPSGNDGLEKKVDKVAVSEFRTATARNYGVTYIEEMVMNGIGTLSVIKAMENQYELVIVGRQHDSTSQLLSGLTDWHDHEELGIIPDLCISEMVTSKTAILVVQQHLNPIYEGPNPGNKNFTKILIQDGDAESMPLYRRAL